MPPSSLILATSAAEESTAVDEVADTAAQTAETVVDSAVDQLTALNDFFAIFSLNNILTVGVRVLVIVVFLGLTYRIARTLINRAYAARYAIGRVSDDSRKQLETMRRIILSVIFYAIIIIGAMAILSIFGFDIRALAASAGIAGAALVLISQNVILDWINGAFIIVERQFVVGDYVKLGEHSGVVQSITIRNTVIKTDFNETVRVPNGDISTVVNYSQEPVTEFFDIRIHDATRLDEGLEVLAKVCDAINARHEVLLKSPCRILGVQEIVGPSATLRLTFQSWKPDTYPILRSLREESIRALTAAGLQMKRS